MGEARDNGWLGEVQALQVSLDAATQKLTRLEPTSACPPSCTQSEIRLGRTDRPGPQWSTAGAEFLAAILRMARLAGSGLSRVRCV
jgi:hypothetical protein